MKRSILIAFIIPIFILSSCENSFVTKKEQVNHSIEDKQIIFFSDNENIDQEAVYYDALLAIKNDYPKEFKNMKVIFEKEKKYSKLYEIDEFPSLIVIKKDLVVAKVEGTSKTKNDIVQTITQALSTQ
ncbi:hypothetical protein [Metabacillus malikii]|uniref:Small peptidoglycan-associated lipoprotein n=1 Tax=Metabacillus malikii TaxID=1504265 RepID=A0ABT9ZGC4_9BACI|nr:hypothetical protein [Metabacillus malikii]MDQ0231328.1 hypothetical protein [Metabacillus malikii]